MKKLVRLTNGRNIHYRRQCSYYLSWGVFFLDYINNSFCFYFQNRLLLVEPVSLSFTPGYILSLCIVKLEFRSLGIYITTIDGILEMNMNADASCVLWHVLYSGKRIACR